MQGIGLVLEGGGMRGVYTAGVLDFFLEKQLNFPYVVGVSAGACHAMSYLSKQHGRNRTITVDYIQHPQYISWRNLYREKSLFGLKLIFDEIPNQLVPFDFATFQQTEQTLVVGVTHCETGKPVYFDQHHTEDILSVVKASSSLPFFSPIVHIQDQPYLDGGVAAPIPIDKSAEDGNQKHVIILTRNHGYTKKPSRIKWLAQRKYGKYPGLVQSILDRHATYNHTLQTIERMESAKQAFVIRPTAPLQVGRMEKSPAKLQALYEEGYKDASECYDALASWLEH